MKQTYVEYMEKSIRDNWEKEAFTDYQAETLAYGEVAERIYRLHAFFREGGLERGGKVALLGRNSTNWAIVYLAVTTYGATVVPILPDFHPSDFENIIAHSDSRFLYAAPVFFEKLDRSRLGSLVAAFSLSDFGLMYAKDGYDAKGAAESGERLFASEYRPKLSPCAFSLEAPENDELESIVYTSGTTGFSKGVMLTHGNIISNLVYAQDNVHLKGGDTILSFLPLAHMFGNAFEFIFPFSRGCHITFLGKVPTTKVLIEAFARVKPRMVLSVPLVIEKIYYKQIRPMLETPRLKTLTRIPVLNAVVYRTVKNKILGFFGGNVMEVIIGGASFNPEVEDFLTKIRFPFTVGYGMTECAPLIGYSDWRKRAKASAGKLVDRMEIKIENGEYCVRGENVTKGYYKNPEETARTIDADGWFHTGDLGFMDKDGSIHIKGRSKTMILGASGQNIYPEEIEAKLNNLPLVAESLVIDDDGTLTALVYPDLAEAKNRGIAETAISETMEKNRLALNKMLPEFGRIARIKLHAEEFLKTPTNKIKRFLYSKKAQ